MGAFGEAFAAFAQPLIDQTDGSPEQVQKALSLSQLCYNTALLPADKREEMFAEFRSSLDMDDDEFDDFRRSLLDPMIARHEEMFPFLHQRMRVSASGGGRSSWLEPRPLAWEPRPPLPRKNRRSTATRPVAAAAARNTSFAAAPRAADDLAQASGRSERAGDACISAAG